MIVMKFGGTSVADSEAYKRVIDIIKEEQDKKIIVVSAIAKATRTLTEAFKSASQNNLEKSKKTIADLKKRHEEIASELITNKKLLDETKTKIEHLFSELNIALEETAKNPENHDYNMAQVLAFGELLSSTILHAAMLENKIESELIDAREIIYTDSNYKKASPIFEKISHTIPSTINKYLNFGKTVITQGFIASTPEGKTTLLGLEGSDLSASLIGMAMDANEIQIWTDVDGIMTSDPKEIKNTKSIPHLSYEDAANLSFLGAKVIHPETMEPASQKNIPMRILNSLNKEHKGTLISNANSNNVRAISYKENIKIVNIPPEEKILQKFLTTLNKQKIAVDAAIESEENIHIIFDPNISTSHLADNLDENISISFDEESSLIGIIGKYDQNPKEMLENILKILDGFAVKMIVYDSLSTSIIMTIQRNDLIPAVQELHDLLIG